MWFSMKIRKAIQLRNKKQQTTDRCNNLDESPENYAELKKKKKKANLKSLHTI